MKSKKRFNVLLAVFIGVFCAFVSFGCAKNKKGPITPEEPPSPQPTQYTVTYRYNYEGAPDNGVFATRSVTENTAATKPSPDPTREEYVFTGWYVDSACLTEYDFSALITAAKDLYAGWEEQETPPAPPTKYSVTVNPATFGTVTVDKAQAEAGETVTVTATPASGYELNTLVYNDGSDHDIKATKQFAMPEKAVTVTATFAPEQVTPPTPPTKYAVTVNAATNGTVTADKTQAEAGETVTVTTTPASGYELDTLVYNDGSDHDIKASKQFVMPERAVTVTATFALIQVTPPTPPTKYAVTVNPATFGTVTVDKTQAEAGETVTVTATPASGYELDTLVYNDGSDHDIKATKQFAMPEKAVTVTATFAPEQVSPDPAYAVTYHYNYTGAPDNGVYTTQNVTENTAATKPAVDPTRTGYTFTKWYIDAACNTEYDFSTLVTAAKDLYAGWNRNAPVLTGITVTPPTKTQYVVNQAFNPSGLNVTAQFDYGDDETLSKGDGNNGYSYVTPVLDAVGTKTVTVSYKGMTDTFTLTVIAREMTSLTISGALASPSQYIGETLSTAGLTFTANYNDGQKETIAASAITFTSTGKLDATDKFTALGAATITASYGGRSATFGVTVIEHAVTKLEIGGELTTSVYEKDARFDPAGLTFTATLDNDETVNVAAGDVLFTAPSLSNGKLTSYGAIQITASYKGVASATKINVTVNAPDTLEVGAWYLLGTFNEWGAAASTTQYKLTVTAGTENNEKFIYAITNVTLKANDTFKIAKYAGKNGTENTFAEHKDNNAVSVDPTTAILGAIVDTSDNNNIKINSIDTSVKDSGWNITITEYESGWVAVNIKLFGFVDWRDPATGAHSDNISASNPQAGDIELRGNFTNNFASSDKWSSRNTDIVTKIGNVYYFENVYLKAHDSFKVVKVGDPDTWLGTNGTFAVGETLALAEKKTGSTTDGAPNIYLGAITDGLYNIVIDAANNTITIYEAKTLAVEFKANVKIKEGETPKKADLTVTYGGAAVGDDYVLNAEAATRGDNSITVIYNGAVAELHYTAYGEFSVTFNKNTNYNPVGMPTDIPAVLENTKLDEPTAPTLKGFIFGGWYKDNACTQVWNFDTDTVSAQRTLYAKWTANTYTIVFEGAESDNATTYTAEGGMFSSVSLNPPVRTNYNGYWWTLPENGERVLSLNYNVLPDNGTKITLYAQFTPITYGVELISVTEDGLEISFDGNAIRPYVFGGDELVLPIPTLAADNEKYVFIKWYFNNAEPQTKDQVTALNETTVGGKIFNGGDIITLRAVFEKKATHNVAFDLGYQGAPEIDRQTVLDGDAVDEPTVENRLGYKLVGWTVNDAAYDFATPVKGDITIIAKWEVIEYTVNYIGAACGTNPRVYKITDGSVNLVDGTATEAGYYFTGWYTSQTGGEQVTRLFAGSIPTTGNKINIYGHISNVYNVRFIANANELDNHVMNKPSNTTVVYGNLVPTPAQKPTLVGYAFMGWYKDSACSEGQEWNFETDIVNGHVDIYAKWEVNVVVSLTVKHMPTKVNYFAGDELELDGLVVTLTYLDGSTIDVAGEAALRYVTIGSVPAAGREDRPLSALAVEIGVKLIENAEVNTTFGVCVYNKVTKLEISNPPDKLEYADDTEMFSTTGMKLTVYFNNGEKLSMVLANGYETNPKNNTAVGYATRFIVTYKQDMGNTGLVTETLTAELPITVVGKAVKSIAVKSEPTNKEYFIGEDIDFDGLVITVTYTDDTTSDVAYSATNADSFKFEYVNTVANSNVACKVTFGEKATVISGFNMKALSVTLVKNVLYDNNNAVDDAYWPTVDAVTTYDSNIEISNPFRGEHDEYRFDGWFTDSACTEQNRWGVTGDANTVGNVTSSMTLYAKWVAQANGGDFVAVTYDKLDPTASSATVKHYAVGSQIALENPSVTGYTFDGWYTDAACTVRFNEDGAYTVWQEHTVLYCKWNAETYTVTYVVPEGLKHNNNTSYSAANGEVTLNEPEAPTDKKFVWWSTSSEVTLERPTEAVDKISLSMFGDGTTLTLYAIYHTKNYLVEFNYCDGSGNKKEEWVNHGEKVAAPTVTYAGHKLLGWFESFEIDGQLVEYEFDPDAPITDNHMYNARWAEYRGVEFVYNDGVTEPVVTANKYVDGDKIEKPADPTRDGFRFDGWSDGGKIWDFDVDTVSGNVTLTAQWTEVINNVTVAFLLDEGGETLASVVLPAGTPIGNNKPADPTRDGFRFLGWFVGETEYTNFDADVEESLTLTAKWVQVFNVTFMWNYDGAPDDGVISTVKVDKGGNVVRPAKDPVREKDATNEYSFNGWFVDAAGKTAFDFANAKINEPTMIYAKWTPLSLGVMSITEDGASTAIEKRMLDNTANMGADEQAKYDRNYAFFGDQAIALTKGSVLKFIVSDKEITFRENTYGHGTTYHPAVGNNVAYLTVNETGTFEIYLKRDKGKDTWEVYASDGKKDTMTFYLYGEMNGESIWDFETGLVFEKTELSDADVAEAYTVTAELTAGDRVKVYADKAADGAGWSYNNYASESWSFGKYETYQAGNSDKNFVIKASGTFTFTLKLLNNKTHVIDVTFVEKEIIVGMTVDSNEPVVLARNATPTDTATNLVHEFYAGAVTLDKDSTVTFTLDGKSFDFHTASCHGVTLAGKTFTVSETGEFEIYVRYYDEDPKTGDAACWVISINDGKTDVLVDGAYYVVGTMNGWALSAAYELKNNVIELTLAAGDQFKVAQNNSGEIYWDGARGYGNVTTGIAYVSDGGGGNIKITTGGKYKITRNGNNIEITSDEVKIPTNCELVGNIVSDSDSLMLDEVTPTNSALKQFSITVTITAESNFKVKYLNNYFNNIHTGNSEIKSLPFVGGNDWDNLILENAGTYTIVLQVWNTAGTDCSINVSKA